MKVPIGPHQRQGRRRRRWKAVALCLAVAMVAGTSSMAMRDKPAREPRRLPDRSALAWMLNRAAYSPWDAQVYAKQYPELSDLFLSAKLVPRPTTDEGR